MSNSVHAMQTAVQAVTQKMAQLDQTAQNYSVLLSNSLAAMANIKMEDVAQPATMQPPSIPTPGLTIGSAPEYTPDAFNLPSMPSVPNIDALLANLDVGDMDALPDAPTMPALNLPDAPSMNVVAPPVRPNISTEVELPDAPTIVMPEMEALERITIPDFEFPQLPDFDAQPPSAAITVPNVFMNWTEPVYESELLDELMVKVNSMMAGGSGLPRVVEEALFARARERDSAETKRAVQEAFDTWAARNFTMPPGMLNHQVAVIREQGSDRAAQLNRDVMIEAAKWEIEGIRFAVTQAISTCSTPKFPCSTPRTSSSKRWRRCTARSWMVPWPSCRPTRRPSTGRWRWAKSISRRWRSSRPSWLACRLRWRCSPA